MCKTDYITMANLIFNDKPFSAMLGHLFLDHNFLDIKVIFDYISVGQYYWIFKDGERTKVRVTHKYGGVIFYVTDDNDFDFRIDHFDVGSVLCCTMIPCKIFRYELAYHIAKCRGVETEEVYDRLKKQGFYIPDGLEVKII